MTSWSVSIWSVCVGVFFVIIFLKQFLLELIGSKPSICSKVAYLIMNVKLYELFRFGGN